MRIEVEKSLLMPVLDKVASVASVSRQNLPILNNILLVANGEELKLRATDLEIDIQTRCECYVPEAGAITLSAKKLREIVRALPNNVDLHFTVEEEKCKVKSGRSRFTLATLPAMDYPSLEFGGEQLVDFIYQPQYLLSALNKVRACMAKDDVRYYLNGVLFHFASENQLRLIATDGHRMGFVEKVSIDLNCDFTEHQFIVTNNAVGQLMSVLNDKLKTTEQSLIAFSGKNMQATFCDIIITTKLCDSKYPDYERVIPDVAPHLASVDRVELTSALKRMGILSNEKYKGVTFNVAPNKLTLKASNTEREESEEELECQYEGDEYTVGFNINYLLDIMNAHDGKTIVISALDGNNSASFFNEDEDDRDSKHVLMPMRL